MKVYIIKYALTKGIFEAEGEPAKFKGFVTVDGKLYNKNDWAGSEFEAKYRAEQMRQKKIATLERSLDRVKSINLGKIKPWRPRT